MKNDIDICAWYLAFFPCTTPFAKFSKEEESTSIQTRCTKKNNGSNVFVVFCGQLERKKKRIKGLDVHLPVVSAAQDLSIKETLLRIYFLPSFLFTQINKRKLLKILFTFDPLDSTGGFLRYISSREVTCAV